MGSSIRLIIEIVSTNWQDDYALKLNEYEAMGIPELGGRRYIGSPKLPIFSDRIAIPLSNIIAV